MPCILFNINGARGLMCTGRQRPKRCACGSGRGASLLCDWKVEGGTCDRPICEACTTKPADGKDLCPEHAEAWKAWQGARIGEAAP